MELAILLKLHDLLSEAKTLQRRGEQLLERAHIATTRVRRLTKAAAATTAPRNPPPKSHRAIGARRGAALREY
jgi:hypothetical protein